MEARERMIQAAKNQARKEVKPLLFAFALILLLTLIF